MEYAKTISAIDFHNKYRRTGVGAHAIFCERKPLMEKIYATGNPIYCDQSYYVHRKEYDLVERDGESFKCEMYAKFEEWRDCHYYSEWEDNEGNKVWLMTGGRYD